MSDARQRPGPDGWIFAALLVLLVWAPLPLASNRPWAWSVLEVGVFALAGAWLALFGLGFARLPGVFRRAWRVVALFGIWVGVVAIQIIPFPVHLVEIVSPESVRAASWAALDPAAWVTLSVDANVSREFLLKSFGYLVAFCLVLVLANSRSRLKALAFALVGSGLLQATLASFLHLSGRSFEVFYTTYVHSEHAVGTFVNRNHLAGYLEMTLAIGIGAMIATLRDGAPRTWRQRFRDWSAWALSPRILLRLMLVVMVIALVMTRSRMGNTAFFVSMLIAGVIGLILSKHATRSTVVLLASLIVIDIFIVGAWFGVEKVVQRIEQTTLLKEEAQPGGSVEERVEPGWNALGIVRDYPWFGSGGGTFSVAFPRYRAPEIGAFFDFAHNDYVQFAVETGMVGVSLLALLVLSTLWMALKTQYERTDPLARGVAFGVTMGIIALMIHSAVDFNLQIPANALTFVVLLAMGWVAYSVERRERE